MISLTQCKFASNRFRRSIVKGRSVFGEYPSRRQKGEENEMARKKRFGRLDFERIVIVFGSEGERGFFRVLTEHTAQRVCACFNTV